MPNAKMPNDELMNYYNKMPKAYNSQALIHQAFEIGHWTLGIDR